MIILHIGVEKTGTTFLQRAVFPNWAGICYVASGTVLELVRCFDERPLLFSEESLWTCKAQVAEGDDRWRRYGRPDLVEASVQSVARLIPGAEVVLTFRRHDNWLLSLYRQYLHEGGVGEFSAFFDPAGGALVPPENVGFRHLVATVERAFGRLPHILLQEDLAKEPAAVLRGLASRLGLPPPQIPAGNDANGFAHNRGVGRRQAEVLRWLNSLSKSEYNPDGPLPLRGPTMRRLRLDPRRLTQDWLMRILPAESIRLSESIGSAIEDLYRDDWRYISDRAIRGGH